MGKSNAFTFVEVLVVLGIVLILTLIAMSVFVPRTSISRTTETVSNLESLLYQCQQNAYGGKDGIACGLKFFTGYYEMYTGTSYAQAVTKDRIDYPEGTTMTSVNFGGGSEVTFSSGEFRPSTAGTLEVSDGVNSFEITVTEEGLIYFN